METLSFAFGVLTVIAVVLITVVVVGMVKVFKMQKQIEGMTRWIESSNDEVHQRITNDYQNLDRIITDDRKELSSRIDEVYRYTDSRFDKMENKFTIGHKTSKQIIND